MLRQCHVFSGVMTQNDYYDYNEFVLLGGAMSTHVWTVAEAKAKFSEVLEKAQREGPQKITRHGRTAAMVVAAEEWNRKSSRKGDLAEFFAASPLAGAGVTAGKLKIRLNRPEL